MQWSLRTIEENTCIYNSSPYYVQLDVHFYRIQTFFFLMKEKDTLGRNIVYTLYHQTFYNEEYLTDRT